MTTGAGVVVLGGAGRTGRHAVRTVLALGLADRLVIADRDGAAAARVAGACGPPAVAAAVDLEDGPAVARALAGADVVLNAAGPFHAFGAAPLAAAIDAGCHYLDVGDDWEATLDMLAFEGRARTAGVSAVIGIGASPGITNLLAARAVRELDRVDTLHTGWSAAGAAGGDDGTPGASAAVAHFLHQIVHPILVRREGRLAGAMPLEPVALDFPGMPRVVGWTIGHPEPITLGRWWPALRESTNVMVAPQAMSTALRDIAGAIRRGVLSLATAANVLVAGAAALPAAEGDPSAPTLFALAKGWRGGRPTTVAASLTALPPGGMPGVTGTPLAVALALLRRGAVAGHGVAPPEAAFEPGSFFDALAPHCAPARRGREDLVAIRCAPTPARASNGSHP
jgi:hypothetical protein